MAKRVFSSFPVEQEPDHPQGKGVTRADGKKCQQMRFQVLWEVRKELANSDEGSPKIILKK